MTSSSEIEPRANRRGKIFTLLLGIVVFGGVIVLSGDDSLNKIDRVYPLWLVAAGMGVALMLALFSARWRVVANALAGRDLGSSAAFFFYSVTASATSLFMPQTANVVLVRTVMLNTFTGTSLTQAGASVLLDKLFDLLPVILLFPPALALIAADISLDVMLGIILIEIAITALLVRRYHFLYMQGILAVLRLAATIAQHVPVLKRLNVMRRLDKLETTHQLSGEAVQIASMYTLVGTLAMLLRSWLIAQSVGLAISPLELIAGMALAQASLLIAITPGALGTLELGWYLGLSAAGVPADTIGAFLIAHRLLQSAFILVIYLGNYALHLAHAFEVRPN